MATGSRLEGFVAEQPRWSIEADDGPIPAPARGCTASSIRVDGLVYLYTQFETYDANRMFACFDQPDLKADVRASR